MTEHSPRLTHRHLYDLETLALGRGTFHPRDGLLGVGRHTLADLIERGFIEAAEGRRRGEPASYRATASALTWMEETRAARQTHLKLRNRRQPRPAPVERHPLADAVTAAVARLAAGRGLAVEQGRPASG